MSDAAGRCAGLARALREPAAYPQPAPVQHLETHISHVFLTGEHAYKIKKPVALGFLDFSTLARRKHFCEEELRINRRLAPDVYLDVVPITGSCEAPRVEGQGEPIEYAVKMRRFRQEDVLDCRARAGALQAAQVDEIAAQLADFHLGAAIAGGDTAFGTPRCVQAAADGNFEQLAPLLEGGPAAALARLHDWTRQEGARLTPDMARRKESGKVRECHGDLHLGNVAVLEGRIVMFDALEFDEALRWTDTLSDAAFLAMDLHAHDRPDLAARFVDAWLSHSGDYSDLALLRYYEVYRALVRAKVAALRAQQESEQAGRQAASERCAALIGVAEALARPGAPVLVLLHGVSGSGKTWGAQHMLEATGAVRIRSDVERKRLRGMTAQEHSGSAPGRGLYAHTATEETYAHLAALARAILRAGYPVLVDATFLRASQRRMFMRLAREERVPLRIADFVAAHDVLRARVGARLAAGGDASEATLEVLERQLRTREPLSADERAIAMQFDTSAMSQARIGAQARALLHDVHT
ncbi:MAG: AAA family ATPase [Burkholderiales bacterium]|nr:AAA family ATPase [Burkholderiales bacterium]